MGKAFRKYIGVIMSWRIVVIENQAKLDYKMGYMVVRGLETKRVLLDEIGILVPALLLTSLTSLPLC